MKTIKKSKLNLDRETLLELDRQSLDHARGGAAAEGGNGRTIFPVTWIPVSGCACNGGNAD